MCDCLAAEAEAAALETVLGPRGWCGGVLQNRMRAVALARYIGIGKIKADSNGESVKDERSSLNLNRSGSI